MGTEPDVDQPRASWTRRLRPSGGTVLILLVLAGVLYMQWPMIKGRFYSDAAPPDGIAWRTDFAAALSEAGQSGKLLLVDVSASWCPPCKVMKHEVWPDEKVREAVESGYIPVLIDPDLPASRDVLSRYNVRGYPTVIVVDPAGKSVREANFLTRDAMLRFLGTPG